MSTCSELQKNNIGSIFRKTIYDQDDNIVDISSASVKQFIFTKPGGSQLTKSTSFTTDGTDGKIQYASVSGDLDETGTWSYQAYIVFVSGTFYSEIDSFKVNRNL